MAVRGHLHPGNRCAIVHLQSAFREALWNPQQIPLCLAGQALSRINTHHQRHMREKSRLARDAPACAGSESKAAPRERESIQEAICTGGVMKKSIGQSHSIGTAPRLLTIKQVADRLTVSVGCLRAWRIRGEGPPAIRVGSALRWDEREVEAWLNARRESGGLAS